ncbi:MULTISPECIES: ABC transporter ATP-binding protein [unclassified Carboxylicivirga]|uniref:ABC transporter ATP-binding protein n=1 Tax=Carboxylicivirga TaxID=1628153 RepID=UPI003D33CE5B
MNIINKLSLSHLLESLRIVYHSSKKWTLINAAVTVVRGIVPLLLLYVVKQLIDVVSHQLTGTNIDAQQIYTAIGLTAAFFLLNAISGSVAALVRERQSHFVNDYVQNIIHKKTIHLAYQYFEDANFQDTFYRALNDASYRPARVFYNLLQTLQSSLTLILVVLVLTNIHWGMVPLLVISGAPIFYYRISYTRKLYRYRREHTEDERRVHYFNRLLTAKDFAKELRVFNLGETFKNEYETFKNELREKQWSLSKTKTLSEIFVQLFATLILLFIIGFVVMQAVKGEISSGSMAMYFLALQRAYAVLQGLLSGLSSLYEDNLFLKNFFAFRTMARSEEKLQAPFPTPLCDGISFDKVSFKYPNTEKWVLKDISLHIPKGKTIALVGRNGCGKTTLVKLLCGLYQPNEGQIKADQQDWSSISREALARHISVIFQDFMLYNVSAQDNVRYGNTRRNKEERFITEAADKAGIHHLFSDLPQGYNTPLGTLFKGSQMLSRGEWQRTALARSFYNTDAQLIILDEPTSSLDAFTEARLIEHFKDITKDKTAIIVSHRLSTIKLADIVVVMQDAGIAEIGTPDALMAQKGMYYNMIESLK